jgi:hypothetical protein
VKERPEAGEDKREFEELLNRDWLVSERRRKVSAAFIN